MPDDIRIDDLAAPRLDENQKATLAYGDTLSVELTRESILAAARERAGMSDFGSPDFLERLDLLLDEWGSDGGLTGIGRLSLRNKLVLYATSRLLIHRTLTEHPEILDLPVERPIIVAGLPRSGTTHLLNLMAADRSLRSLPLWESYEPLPLPGEVLDADGVDPRYRRCGQQWEAMRSVTPHLAAMHPMDPDHIHEELELMGPDFASYNFEWLSMSPRFRDHYYATDQTPHYEYMKRVLQILQWRHGDDRRWVLKCPQHLEQLPVLLSVFPDATVAVTHRDPVSVVQSAVTMLAYGQRISREKIETHALIEYWSDRIEHLLRACVRDRPGLPCSQSIDVPFHDLMADDVAMVGRIYALAGLELNDDARAALLRYRDQHRRGAQGRVVYDLERDFGVAPATLRERFRFYFEAFPVRIDN